MYDEPEIEDIVKSLEDMDAEEYDKVSPELKALYISYGLECRRNKYLETHGL